MIALAAMLLALTPPQPQAGTVLPQRRGECRWVHGRLHGIYNGATPFRIWVIGTTRMVAVQDELYSPSFELPANLQKAIDAARYRARRKDGTLPIDFDAWGDYRICALIRDRPGYMLMARLTHARNVTVRAKHFPPVN